MVIMQLLHRISNNDITLRCLTVPVGLDPNALYSALQRNTNLRYINLSALTRHPSHHTVLQEILSVLPMVKELRTVDLGQCCIGDETVTVSAVAEFIRNAPPHLQRVDFTDNTLSNPQHVEVLCQALAGCPTLTSVVFRRCGMGDAGLQVLASTFPWKSCTTLQFLELSHNNGSSSEIMDLVYSKIILQTPTLATVVYAGNHANGELQFRISEALKVNKKNLEVQGLKERVVKISPLMDNLIAMAATDFTKNVTPGGDAPSMKQPQPPQQPPAPSNDFALKLFAKAMKLEQQQGTGHAIATGGGK
eukprot:PhF_6_TR11235/c0_g1_i1/m.18112